MCLTVFGIGMCLVNKKKTTTVTYFKNNKQIKKSYDYVIVTFPLTKNIKDQNFTLDLFYRDFLDCEMFNMYQYLIDGELIAILKSDNPNKQLNLHTIDPKFKFQSIRSLKPLNSNINSKTLYGVYSTENLIEKDFEKVFLNGYKVIDRVLLYSVPLYKKVRYSHTPFPNVIIDEESRSRIYYLNSLEWLFGSKETKCLSARNIALLISQKELGNNFLKNKTPIKFVFNNYYEKIRTLNYYILISLTLFTFKIVFKTFKSFYINNLSL